MSDVVAKGRALLAKSTVTPWRHGSPEWRCKKHHRHGEGACVYTELNWLDGTGDIYVDRPHESPETTDAGLIAGQWDYTEGGIRREDDAALIVFAVNHLGALLDVAEAAPGVLELLAAIGAAGYEPSSVTYWPEEDRLRSTLARLYGKEGP